MMTLTRRMLAGLIGTLVAGPALAALDVVASTSDMGLLARQIGGEQVQVTVLAPPDRDAHHLQARPSMIRALRGADLLVLTGSDLEIGWLPAAIRSAANPAILPGRPGYFAGADQVPLLDAGAAADRGQGDVHRQGNPHFSLDPLRYAQAGEALARRLGQLDEAHAGDYRQRAEAFTAAIRERLPDWQAALADAPGAVLYHKDADYLLSRFDVPLLGLLEPVPGVPPTARHLKDLVGALRDSAGVVIYHPYHSPAAPRRLAGELGWKAVVVPAYPPLNAGAEEYFQLIDHYVQALRAR